MPKETMPELARMCRSTELSPLIFEIVSRHPDIGNEQPTIAEQLSLVSGYRKKYGADNFFMEKVFRENFFFIVAEDSPFVRRHRFKKDGSVLIPLAGKGMTGVIIRIISGEAFNAWKLALDAGIPCERILADEKTGKTMAFKTKNGSYRVYTRYEGERIADFIKKHPGLEEEVLRQRREIETKLDGLGIEHGHLYGENYTVLMENDKPVVRVIDFDEARVQLKKGDESQKNR